MEPSRKRASAHSLSSYPPQDHTPPASVSKEKLYQQPSADFQSRDLSTEMQQQQRHNSYPSSHALTLHIRTHPSPPVKPKNRHHEQTQPNYTKQYQQRQFEQKQPNNGQSPSQSKRKLYLHLTKQNSQPIALSTRKPSAESFSNPDQVMTSQPLLYQPTTTRSAKNGNGTYHKTPHDRKSHSSNADNGRRKTTTQINPEKQKPKVHSFGQAKKSKVSVGDLGSGIPRHFEGSPDKQQNSESKGNKSGKLPPHDLTGIPQTNLSVGLIVFCCFNPLFGAIAVYLSLAAAKAYRDGREASGNSRAHWSILISLFGITVTMVIVSTLVVVLSVSKHSNSHYRHATSKAFGL